MKTPLILVEKAGPEITIFQDRSAVEAYVEATDVENDEYALFDSDGQKLMITATTERTKILGFIPAEDEKIEVTETNVADTRSLKEYALAYLAKHNRLPKHADEDTPTNIIIDLIKRNANSI